MLAQRNSCSVVNSGGMKRCDNVRLRNGIGWVSTQKGTLVPPPDGDTFQVGHRAGADDGAVAFYVADIPRAVAVLENDRKPLLASEKEEEVARRLLEAHFPVVAWIGPEASGATVAHCYSRAEDAIEEAACGIWALKALGGWDESSFMTFYISHIAEIDRDDRSVTVQTHQAAWVTVRSKRNSNAWTLDIRRLRPGGWEALREELAGSSNLSGTAIILADIDWAQAYNDAYGHQEGDLMLARVQAFIEGAADQEGAKFIRVGGDDFALLVPASTHGAAGRLAETIRRGVEAMNIPFQHPEVRTHGRVTISAAVVVPNQGREMRALLEDAVYRAKRAGRNVVANNATST